MLTCSKCKEPAKRAIIVPCTDKPTTPKNENGVRIIRFCPGHWTEVEELLPAAA